MGPPRYPTANRRGYATGNPDYLTRLGKIEGQVRGLQKMIENDTWCPDVVTQVGSVTRAPARFRLPGHGWLGPLAASTAFARRG